MDANQVAQAVTDSGVQEAYSDAVKSMNAVWLQNRKVLFSMVLDEKISDGIDAAKDLPVLIDEAIDAFIILREKAMSLAWDLG